MATPSVKKTLVLGNNGQLVFSGVVIINFREDPIFMSPGLDTLGYSSPGDRALLHMINAAFVNLACLPDPYFSKSTGTVPRPAGAPPGPQLWTPLAPKAGCNATFPVTSPAAIPDDIVNFCWPAMTTYVDMFTVGVDIDWSVLGAAKPVLAGYKLWLQNSTMYCGRPLPTACVDSLTPVGCYYSLNPRGNGSVGSALPSASPPPAALAPSPSNGTNYGSAPAPGTEGGGGDSSSDILAPVLGGVLGGLAALAVVAAAAVWAVRRRRRQRDEQQRGAPGKAAAPGADGTAAATGGRPSGSCAAADDDRAARISSGGAGTLLQHKGTSASTDGLCDGLGTRTTGTVGTLGDIERCSFSTQPTACGGESAYGDGGASGGAAALLSSVEALTPARRHARAHSFARPSSGTAGGMLPAARAASIVGGGSAAGGGSPACGSANPGSPHAAAAVRSPSGLARSLLSGAASAAGSFLGSMGGRGGSMKRSSLAGKSFMSSLPPEEEAVAAAALVPVTAQTPLQNLRTDVRCSEGDVPAAAFLLSTVTEARASASSGSVPAAADGAGGAGGGTAGVGTGGVLPAAAPNQIILLPVVRGKGSFGRVVEGIYNGQRVAVKILSEGLYMSHLRQPLPAAAAVATAAVATGGAGATQQAAHAQAAVAAAAASDAAAAMGSAALVDSTMGPTGGAGTTLQRDGDAGGAAGSWQLYESTMGAGAASGGGYPGGGGGSSGGGGGGGAAGAAGGWGGMQNVQRRAGVPSGGVPLASQEVPTAGGADGAGTADDGNAPGGGLPAAAPPNWQVYESVGTSGGTASGTAGGGGLGARLAGFWQQRLAAAVAPEVTASGVRAQGQGPPAPSGSCREGGESDGSCSQAAAGASGAGAASISAGAGGVRSPFNAGAAPAVPEWQQYQSVGTGGGQDGGFARAVKALASSGDQHAAGAAAEPPAGGKAVDGAAAAAPAAGAISEVQPKQQQGRPQQLTPAPQAVQPAPQPQHANALERTFMQEVEVLARCRHPNIVQLLAACLTPPRICLVMELMDTSLDKLLHGVPGRLLPLPTVLHIGCQVARALEYLHPTIIHRDLKPGNVLISDADSPAPVAKLADFGLSRLRDETLRTRNPDVGTAGYMAPELFAATAGDATVLRQTRLGGGGRHGIKNAAEREAAAAEEEAAAVAAGAGEVAQGGDQDGGVGGSGRDREAVGGTAVTDRVDVWALGVLLWEMLSGQRPWAGTNMVQVAVAVALRRERLPFTAVAAYRCPPRLRALIEQCWEWDPARRPAAAEVSKELGLLRQELLVAAGQRSPSMVFSGSSALLVPQRAGSASLPWAASASAYGGFLASGGGPPSGSPSPRAGSGADAGTALAAAIAGGGAGGDAAGAGANGARNSADLGVSPSRADAGTGAGPAAAAVATRPPSGPWRTVPQAASLPPQPQVQQAAQVPPGLRAPPTRAKSRLSFSTSDSRAVGGAPVTGNAAAASGSATAPGEASAAEGVPVVGAEAGAPRSGSDVGHPVEAVGAAAAAALRAGGERASGGQPVALVVPAGPGPGAGALGVRAEEAEAAAAKYPAERWVPRRR
ncbi:hypothetical protein HXX76_008945 [Chlamydomonas incerta]|uniref:Protein kinase domain-containing protein n=1 Tax=Chlamydomonas incerta TaxID=51695 RepID=A0A835T6L6_CHLIN|nr:hypothetical protein HXX76_008945 [Chlamydomonas incerta]|eukprot:KAG2432605.1 hypothetical protein HXX76_008945 [Chlamydomonas incerta]